MGNFRHITQDEISAVTLGTIFWLPPKDQLPAGAYVDPSLLGQNEGACNHPVVVVSTPPSTAIELPSHVEIAIITSFHGTMIRTHLAQKGKKYRTGVLAAENTGYLRVVTSSKPYAKDVLKLRNGKGMAKDSAYVNVKKTYGVAISTLAKYGEKEDPIGLTALAAKKLIEGVEQYKQRKHSTKNKKRKREEKETQNATVPRDGASKGDLSVSRQSKRRRIQAK